MEQKIKEQIIEDRKMGLSYKNISEKYNISKSTAAVVCNRQNNIKQQERAEKQKKEHEELIKTIIEITPECFSYSRICKMLGKYPTNTNMEKIKKIISDNNIDISHFKQIQGKAQNSFTEENIFCENSKYQTSKLKDKLIKLGYKEYKCEICGNTEWNSKPIPLETHHINGRHHDNRIENLQLLCPNCHTQTDNYCGKNIERQKKKPLAKIKKEKRTFNIEEIISLFREIGSLYKVSIQMKASFKTIKNYLLANGIPIKEKEFRQYVLENYGEYKKMNSSKSSSYLKEYNKTRRIPVDCYTKEGIFVKHYDYVKQVQEDGFNDKHISECCQGKLKTCQGYIWKYSK